MLPVEDNTPGVFYSVGCYNRASMSRKREKNAFNLRQKEPLVIFLFLV